MTGELRTSLINGVIIFLLLSIFSVYAFIHLDDIGPYYSERYFGGIYDPIWVLGATEVNGEIQLLFNNPRDGPSPTTVQKSLGPFSFVARNLPPLLFLKIQEREFPIFSYEYIVALHFYLQRLFIALFGHNLTVYRIPSVFAMGVFLLLFFSLGRRWFGDRQALISCVGMSFSPFLLLIFIGAGDNLNSLLLLSFFILLISSLHSTKKWGAIFWGSLLLLVHLLLGTLCLLSSLLAGYFAWKIEKRKVLSIFFLSFSLTTPLFLVQLWMGKPFTFARTFWMLLGLIQGNPAGPLYNLVQVLLEAGKMLVLFSPSAFLGLIFAFKDFSRDPWARFTIWFMGIYLFLLGIASGVEQGYFSLHFHHFFYILPFLFLQVGKILDVKRLGVFLKILFVGLLGFQVIFLETATKIYVKQPTNPLHPLSVQEDLVRFLIEHRIYTPLNLAGPAGIEALSRGKITPIDIHILPHSIPREMFVKIFHSWRGRYLITIDKTYLYKPFSHNELEQIAHEANVKLYQIATFPDGISPVFRVFLLDKPSP